MKEFKYGWPDLVNVQAVWEVGITKSSIIYALDEIEQNCLDDINNYSIATANIW